MRFTISSRRCAGLLLLVAAAGLACGHNQVVLDVDVRSFMSDTDIEHPYSAPGMVPFTIRLDSIPVNLIEGFADFGTAESATIDIGVVYNNQLGTGTGRVRLYFSDDSSTLFSTPPAALLDVDLLPGSTVTRTAQVLADQRLLDMFSGKEFWMGADLEWLSFSLEPLQGTASIDQIDLHLVSSLDMF